MASCTAVCIKWMTTLASWLTPIQKTSDGLLAVPKKKQTANRRLVGFKPCEVALLQAASDGLGLDPFSAPFAAKFGRTVKDLKTKPNNE